MREKEMPLPWKLHAARPLLQDGDFRRTLGGIVIRWLSVAFLIGFAAGCGFTAWMWS